MSDGSARAQAIHAGDRRALAQALTLIERGGPAAKSLRRSLVPRPQTRVIGITGAPGAGKSTLTTALALHIRTRGLTIGILAIDPSSPLSGGAILGDRIRMYDLAGDSGVFIRSMANRGRYGGIAGATADAIRALSAAGYDIIMLETVGAGQSDVAVADVADTVLLVESPGMGDEVQSIKAGLLEVADVIAVSKSDRPDANATLQQLRALVQMQHADSDAWTVPVCGVSAIANTGIAALADAVLAHGEWLAMHPAGPRQRRRRIVALQRALEILLLESLSVSPVWQDALATLDQPNCDIEALAEQLLTDWRATPQPN
jgi:LAO/AO transport system kinase